MNTKVVRKPYIDYEKEEAWLNRMAAQGWELRRYTWMRYEFEQGVPGRYTYRMQLLADPTNSPKSREYLTFMEDAGVEVVSTYLNSWVYLRKKTADGPFEVFSDLDSRIAHHKRISGMFSGVFAAVIPSAVVVLNSSREGHLWLAPLILVEIALAASVGWVALREYRKAKDLERQRLIHE